MTPHLTPASTLADLFHRTEGLQAATAIYRTKRLHYIADQLEREGMQIEAMRLAVLRHFCGLGPGGLLQVEMAPIEAGCLAAPAGDGVILRLAQKSYRRRAHGRDKSWEAP